MSQPLLRAAFFVALLAGVFGVAAPARAADTPFSQRYAQTMRGSIEAVGNQLLTCPAAAAGCTNARNRTGAVGDDEQQLQHGATSTSTATGPRSTPRRRRSRCPPARPSRGPGLYWGADTAVGTGGTAAPNAANRGTVRFKVGAGRLPDVTAAPADVLTSTGRATRYRAFANVTSRRDRQRRPTRSADVQTGRGDDRFAGWSLVVAYQDATPGRAPRQRLRRPRHGRDTASPSRPTSRRSSRRRSGTVDTRVGMLAFEGDAGIAVGESQTFNGVVAGRRAEPGRQPAELDGVDQRRGVHGQEPELREPDGHRHRRLRPHRAAREQPGLGHRSRTPPARTSSSRPRCGSSPTRARPSTPPARASAASPATARR